VAARTQAGARPSSFEVVMGWIVEAADAFDEGLFEEGHATLDKLRRLAVDFLRRVDPDRRDEDYE
jgi:hypothetical protein